MPIWKNTAQDYLGRVKKGTTESAAKDEEIAAKDRKKSKADYYSNSKCICCGICDCICDCIWDTLTCGWC